MARSGDPRVRLIRCGHVNESVLRFREWIPAKIAPPGTAPELLRARLHPASGRYLRVIYVPEPDGLFDHRVRFDRKPARRIPKTQKEETSMSQNQLPEGWDHNRIDKIVAHYAEQLPDEALA